MIVRNLEIFAVGIIIKSAKTIVPKNVVSGYMLLRLNASGTSKERDRFIDLGIINYKRTKTNFTFCNGLYYKSNTNCFYNSFY